MTKLYSFQWVTLSFQSKMKENKNKQQPAESHSRAQLALFFALSNHLVSL